MPAKSDPRDEGREETIERAASQYYYRRALRGRALLPAIGAGVAVGLMAFYVTEILLQRTPLLPPSVPEGERSARRKSRLPRKPGG